MKRITFVTLILFVLIVAGVLILGLVFPQPSSNPLSGTAVYFTADEVSQHASETDCYLTVKEKVYDVTTYIYKHPGGSKNITSRCGEEVTGIFASIHSNFAWNLLGDYYIGALSDSTQTIATPSADQFSEIEQFLAETYPGAEIINIKPKDGFYVAKLIYKDKLYEVHVDAAGQILSEEIQNEEFDWNAWDEDADDNAKP